MSSSFLKITTENTELDGHFVHEEPSRLLQSAFSFSLESNALLLLIIIIIID